MEFKDELLGELKSKGLNIAEDALVGVVEAVFDSVERYVVQSENKYDDVALAVLPALKPMVMKWVDKVDGEEG